MLPVRPGKKQRMMTMNPSSASPAVARSSTSASNIATPLRTFTNGSRLVSPLIRGSGGNPEDEDFFKSFKENLPNAQVPQASASSLTHNKKINRDELKAALHRNGQSVTGTVKILLDRIADGEARGKLGLCPQCSGGKLKISDTNLHVVFCSRKLACGFQCSAETAPRCGPWLCVSFDKDDIQAIPVAAVTPKSTKGIPCFKRPSKSKMVTFVSPPSAEETMTMADQGEYAGPNAWGGAPPFPGRPQPTYCPQFPPYRPSPYYCNDGSSPPQYCPPGYPMYGRGYAPFPPSPYMGNHLFPPFAPHHNTMSLPPPERQRGAREGQCPSESRWVPSAHPSPFQETENKEGATFRELYNNDGKNVIEIRPRVHSPAQVEMATRAAKVALERNHSGKQTWTPQEDEVVMHAVQLSSSAFKDWSNLAQHLQGRSGKQIRDHWVNHLNPALVHHAFGHEDDLLLWKGFMELGKSWKEISTKFFHATRSENRIKNRWHSGSYKRLIMETIGPNAYAEAVAKNEANQN